MKFIQALSLTLFVFGLVGFIYIAGNAWFHPRTLSMQLTHFLPYPREDTAGIVSFFVSMISFFIYLLVKDKK
jgi:hypothetical protein